MLQLLPVEEKYTTRFPCLIEDAYKACHFLLTLAAECASCRSVADSHALFMLYPLHVQEALRDP